MSKVIVYQIIGKPVAVVIPATSFLTVDAIGKKDVPAGEPFWVLPISALPKTRESRDAWELDKTELGDPTGYGEMML